MKRKRYLLIVAFLSAGVMACLDAPAFAQGADPLDWTYWRGPEMNGISRERGLPEKWSPKGENLLWTSEELGGRATPIVMQGNIYMIKRDQPGTKKEGEKVVCADASTGEVKWEYKFNVYLSDVPAERVGWASVMGDPETGNVFALGVCGYFVCLDRNGKKVWDHSLSEEYGLLSTYGGRTNFPILHGNLVIVSAVIIGWGNMAKPAHRFIAFDKRNGQPVWFEGTRLLPYDTTYSAPVLTVLDGQDVMIVGSGDGGVHAIQPQTGKKLWTYNVSRRGINTTPLVVGNTVFGGHSEENLDGTEMGALFAINAALAGVDPASREKWRVKEWYVGKSTPLHADGRLYAAEDRGNLLVVDPESGELVKSVKLRGTMRGSPLYADGKLYVCTANGISWIFRPSDDGVEKLDMQRLRRQSIHASPIVSHGRVYITTTETMYCIGLEGDRPEPDERPEAAKATAVGENDQPSQLQIVPVESLLRPGENQRFHVRLFNDRGQFLETVDASKVELTIDGPGAVSRDGKDWKYATTEDQDHSAIFVTAKVGELTGSARVRVVPDFPWSFDFNNGEVPITWVGCRYRHVVIDYDLYAALAANDEMASQLYLFLNSEFINTASDTLTYDNTTPRQRWTAFLRFVNLDESVTNLEQAQAALNDSLERLKADGILAGWEWANLDVGPQLKLNRGPRRVDGNGVMLKITTIPKGTRSQGWFGHNDFNDYTVEADVLGIERGGKLPDIGIIGQRYTFDLMGASQQLQIRTWPPQLRMAVSKPFAWKGGTWYRMKFQSSVEDGKAVLRGKVWPRDEDEPAEWLVEATDDVPNVIGSPGLFGQATNAELMYDNIRIYKNAN